jgi:hypothetical protein
MRVCIICEDSKVSYVREKASIIIPNYNLHMSIPLSNTGILPATHWLCVCNVNEDMYNKLLSVQKYSTIVKTVPSILLEELKLKKIGSK